MTDDQTTPEATEAPTGQPETPQEAPAPDLDTEGTPGEANPSKEAARYRRQLRATERERDQLAEQVTALRRAAVEDRVKSHRIAPEGFWASGVQLEDLLAADGGLDETAIKTAADNAAETLGLQRIGTRGPHVPKEGRVTSPRPSKSWEGAFGAQ